MTDRPEDRREPQGRSLASESQSRLELERDRLRCAVELFEGGLQYYRLDEEGILRFDGGNPQADRLFGVDSARCLGLRLEEAFPLLAGSVVPDRLRAVADGADPWFDPSVLTEHGGQTRRFRVRATRVPPHGVVALFHEVHDSGGEPVPHTPLPTWDHDHVRRMEALGRLAGSIAHEFNNLLTAIAGNVELMSLDVSEADPLRSRLREIRRATERAAALTGQLLAFGRRQILSPQKIDLNEVVDRMHFMMARILGESVKLDLILSRDLGLIHADPGQAEQILVNLVAHARDALSAGGMVTIVTENVDLDAPFCDTRSGLRPGPHIRLRVRDSGAGLPSETLQHIFEPFFSAQDGGKGAGLGLATVYGIVRQHGGHIEASSELGWGTTVDVFFPRVGGVPEPLVAPSASHHLRGRGETILVAEDEPVVRQVTCRLLERLGYQVIEAAQGAEALRLAKEHPGAVDLLLTDVVMPYMNGRELADRLRTLQPEMRVLFMSGHPDDVILEHGVNEERIEFLAKPYTPDSLASAIRRTLDRT